MRFKSSLLLLSITLLITLTRVDAKVVLIDPGHGGEDCGARALLESGEEICEKDLALAIAKMIQKKLAPHFKTYLTRSVDRTVSLEERAMLADTLKADIFLSVHLNASHQKNSHGTETFYLDNHDNVAVKKIENIENRGLKGEELVINKILTDLVIDRTAPRSKLLANKIHAEIVKKISHFGLKNRGKKPALFYVLTLSKRPAVLLEPGFLSNGGEFKKLQSLKFQEDYAEGVALGVRKYFENQRL